MNFNRSVFFKTAIRFAGTGLLGLGLCARGQGTNVNFQALQAAADKGDAKAQYQVARYYSKGIGVPKNYHTAAKYLRQAADQGYAEAEGMLGYCYGMGRGVPRNVVMAVSWYRKAADQGDATAEYAMGNFYSVGRGVGADPDEAIRWWKKAAAQHQADAEAALGRWYLLPTPEHGTNYLNLAEAGQWLKKGAADGSVEAMNDLGVACENGLGVNLDDAEAARWYRAAAEQGESQAQCNLGQLYFDGRGVTNDLVQAYLWFKLSAVQGNSKADVMINTYGTHELLTPDQLAQAERLVLNYRPKKGTNAPGL